MCNTFIFSLGLNNLLKELHVFLGRGKNIIVIHIMYLNILYLNTFGIGQQYRIFIQLPP